MSSRAGGESSNRRDESAPATGLVPPGARGAMFDYVIDTTHEAVVAIDHEGRVSTWNPAAERLTGRPETEAMGMPIHQSLELTEDILHDRLRRAAGGEDRIEDRRAQILRSDGSLTPVALSVSPMLDDDGRPQGAVAVIRDVTEHREAMEALEEADRLKEFLGVVSHELRTPLTSIMGFGHLLSQNATDEIASICDVIMRNATEMQAMVGRILDFSRAQSGRLELTVGDHDVQDVVSEVLTLVESFVSEHEVHVEVAEGLRVHADADGLHRILVNLLTNAGKFTPTGRRVWVLAETYGDRCRISVADEGPGIPDEELESVFERFFQSKSTQSTTARGAGVGLSIVKTYTEAMDGDVWVENLPDAGCRFVVELPGPGL